MNTADYHVVGAGVGRIYQNTTRYRAGVVNCPLGRTAKNKNYTFCDGSGKLHIKLIGCNGKCCHYNYTVNIWATQSKNDPSGECDIFTKNWKKLENTRRNKILSLHGTGLHLTISQVIRGLENTNNLFRLHV